MNGTTKRFAGVTIRAGTLPYNTAFDSTSAATYMATSQQAQAEIQPIKNLGLSLLQECQRRETGHYNAMSAWDTIHSLLGLPLAVLSGLAGGTALAGFKNHSQVAAALAFTAAVLSAINHFYQPREQKSKHRMAHDKFHALTDKVRQFCELDCTSKSPTADLRKKLDALTAEKNKTAAASIEVPYWVTGSRGLSVALVTLVSVGALVLLPFLLGSLLFAGGGQKRPDHRI